MSYLSATDSAIILAVTGLLYDADNNAYIRYVDVWRDIPEYANWMRKMVSKGHTVLLVGKDLEEIELSYKYPLYYWRKHARSHVRSLWLVALTTKMRKEDLGNSYLQSAMDESGDVFKIPMFTEHYLRSCHIREGCSNALCFPSSLSVSYNIPLPLPWPDCAYDMMEKRSWHTLSRDGDSNIDLMYLPNYCSEDMLFDEAIEASEPYFSAIFGSPAPFHEPIAVPYMNMADGEVRTSITDPYMDDAIELPIDMEWAGEEWSEESDMDRFVFAFYQTRVVQRGLELSHRYRFMAIEFTGLDPDMRGNRNQLF
ncbi:hypothetical protein FPOA_13156 [Fusarium poae]|uniref:Uncharacterized protein n=1 Tax=Fusarium poae TaxID=36050 RepID=A0A1B8A6G4_FUSPO|nr:hypothetical protein FPOA_13156 [Fusarium poae]